MVGLSRLRFGKLPILRQLSASAQRWKPILPSKVEAQFRGAGYHIFDPGIPPAVIDRVRADMDARDELRGVSHPGSRWLDGWTTSRAIRSVALSPVVLRVLRQLYGREPLPFQTLNFRIGTQQRLHSDTIHFHSDPPTYMCGVWVALEDIDEENGPLVYYPESHKLPLVTMEDVAPGPGPRYYTNYEDHIERMVKASGLEPKYGVLRKGQALIWAANLIHGGAPQLDKSRTRLSQVTHYFFEGCQHYMPMESYGGYRHLLKPRRVR